MHSVWWGRLNAKLAPKLNQATEYLAGGGAIGGTNPASTGENYMRQVGYIQGLRDALAMAEEVDNEMAGRVVRHAPGDPPQDD